MRIAFPGDSLIRVPVPDPVERVQPGLPLNEAAQPGASEEMRSFSEMMKDSLHEVNRLQLNLDDLSERVSTGRVEDLHTAMIAVQKASLALELTLQVRNKAIESYQEIMRMQL
ncbi:MAG TPA: flagellar hook-basal body complex protein FliE [Armatimonadetes bacterium]|jgi:flagellar hook-basal body complex protein FliE|nr:flagellar hook-basal body complex protein FliE [Armatimonadota bacterium]